MDLLEIRGRLDQIDTQIEKLFEERMRLCSEVAEYKANILTIHQSIPINGKGLLTVSVDIEDSETDVSAMIQDVEKIEDVSYVKIIAME